MGVFCLGSGLYSIAFLRLAGLTHKHLANVHLGLEIFLFVSAVALVIAFVAIWVMEETSGKHSTQHMIHDTSSDNTQHAYIVEHAAYIAQLLFYMIFFLFHSPDPLKPPYVSGVFDGEVAYAQDHGGVAMRPLLHAGVTIVHAAM